MIEESIICVIYSYIICLLMDVIEILIDKMGCDDPAKDFAIS